MADGHRSLSPAWLAGVAVIVAVSAAAAMSLTREGATTPAATTTTTTTTAAAPPDPLAALSRALADRLAATAGIEPRADELRCLASDVSLALGEDRTTELLGHDDPGAALTAEERSALVRAVVECLGPAAAAALLGDGTTTTSPAAQLPDEAVGTGG